ncbi:O-antigen ligase family protein [Micromonospora peucetia]|uniref:O-Antigen ligase n=1 Tax=Micromonospora peucetia TaxID=47871 RepID=A0A1C6UAG4_9ACTN|nr:O-antigen ligase family protein [Micromonospora peucetia]MCX4386389.1 O-antigen ligase family protein [Micromonospora peucetia]WSA33730.1 O-antigen ligase family protein [Micromonospora peucetia]SCL51080.1 O-Antigen ligase [Micromonospora peucetia]
MTGVSWAPPVPRVDPAGAPARPMSRLLSATLVLLVGILLVHVLFETWAQVITGPTSKDPRANLENAPQWPKQLKTALYLGLALLTVVKVVLDRQWRRFRTAADLALLVLGLVMLLAGVVNDSSVTLMGESLFVYFRGVIVFYALRAADLDHTLVRRMLVPVGVVVGVNVVLALVQMVAGRPAHSALGWVDLTWADQSRAQGLQPHPNHLGHLLGLALLGFIAWVAARDRVRPLWWVLATVVAIAMSATQSRESLLGVLAAGVVVAVLVRRGARRVLTVCLIVVLCTAGQIATRPDNRAEWERRIGNAFSGLHTPAGSEQLPSAGAPSASPNPTAPASGRPSGPSATTGPNASSTASPRPSTSPRPTGSPRPAASARPSGPAASATPAPAAARPAAPVREIRVLYLQQAARILPRQPVLGFGIGQFGGVVAEKDNPNWHKNPKFGPEGFNRYGFHAVQVDSFWLHLVMEVGLLGLAVYLVWLAMVTWPLVARVRRDRRLTRAPDEATVWGIAAMVFACLVGFLSPSMEDPLLPPLLWTIVGLAWWAAGRPGSAGTVPADPAPGSVDRNGAEADTRILSTNEILAQARFARRPHHPR